MDRIRQIVDISIDLWSSFVLSGTGVVSNTVNVMVFWTSGFKESSNISLMLIAVIDWVKCLVAFVHRGYGFVGSIDKLLGVNWRMVSYIMNSDVQNLCVPVVNVVTMYLTIERCICLCLPLKVKSLITTQVTAVALTSLSILVVVSVSPMFPTLYLKWVIDPSFNQSVAQYAAIDIYLSNGFYSGYIYVIYIFWNLLSFIVIIFCIVVIIVKLKQHKKVRSQLIRSTVASNHGAPVCPSITFQFMGISSPNSSSKSHLIKAQEGAVQHGGAHLHRVTRVPDTMRPNVSSKESRLVKILFLVILVYMVNILPRLTAIFTKVVVPEFGAYRQYGDLYVICFQLIFCIDLLATNCHVFIYFYISSQFRDTFKKMISWQYKKT